MSALVHLKKNLLAVIASMKCHVTIQNFHIHLFKSSMWGMQWKTSNLHFIRDVFSFELVQVKIPKVHQSNGEIISVQKNVPSPVQVKIRMDTLVFVAKENIWRKGMGVTLQTITMIEEGWTTYGSASICGFNIQLQLQLTLTLTKQLQARLHFLRTYQNPQKYCLSSNNFAITFFAL